MKTYTFHVSLPGAGRVWRKRGLTGRTSVCYNREPILDAKIESSILQYVTPIRGQEPTVDKVQTTKTRVKERRCHTQTHFYP